MTIDELKNRMLSNISDDYDKTEGSFFYDAVVPVAIELEKSGIDQSNILKNAFASTGNGEYLDRKCAEFGIIRKPATKASGEVEIFGPSAANIQIGDLVASELVTFKVVERKRITQTGSAIVVAECTQYGTIGNVPRNTIVLFPVTLEGISEAKNTLPFTNGYDAESDESLRQRYYEKINMPATSGNAYHYKMWAKEVVGVGDAKVFPLWVGNGTVRVVICDSNKRKPDSGLVTSAKSYIETQRPIGATVTVTGANETAINITATIVIGNGRLLSDIKNDFEKEMVKYFKEIAFVNTYVSHARVGSILYSIYGVQDYSNLRLNATTGNIDIVDTQVPALGTVVLSV